MRREESKEQPSQCKVQTDQRKSVKDGWGRSKDTTRTKGKEWENMKACRVETQQKEDMPEVGNYYVKLQGALGRS